MVRVLEEATIFWGPDDQDEEESVQNKAISENELSVYEDVSDEFI